MTNDELAEYVEDMIAHNGELFDWNILEKEYEENIFYAWKEGPRLWNSYDIELEKLSDDKFVEEFIYYISDSPFVHTDKDIDWSDKDSLLNKAMCKFSRFLKKYPEQITKVRKVVQNA